MTQQELKTKLLNTTYFENNEYLDKYCELIINNLKTKKEKYKTECHHIVPKCCFKLLQQNVDNSKKNKVNLLYKDHILAHYYLALCSMAKKISFGLECALFHLLGNKDYKKFSNKEALKEFGKNLNEEYLNKLQLLREDYYRNLTKNLKGNTFKKGKKESKETKQKKSKAMKGRVAINKNGYIKKIFPKYLNDYVSQGWEIGGLPNSEETILKRKLNSPSKHNLTIEGRESLIKSLRNRQISEDNLAKRSSSMKNINKGGIYINKDGKSIHLKDEHKLQEYLDNGWSIGRLNNSSNEWNKGRIVVNKEGINKRILPEEIDNYLKEGWQLGGKCIKDKNLNSKTTLISIIKDNIIMEIPRSQLNIFLNQGWLRAPRKKYERNTQFISKVWINNGELEVKIPSNEVQKYLSENWVKGRLKKRR